MKPGVVNFMVKDAIENKRQIKVMTLWGSVTGVPTGVKWVKQMGKNCLTMSPTGTRDLEVPCPEIAEIEDRTRDKATGGAEFVTTLA